MIKSLNERIAEAKKNFLLELEEAVKEDIKKLEALGFTRFLSDGYDPYYSFSNEFCGIDMTVYLPGDTGVWEVTGVDIDNENDVFSDQSTDIDKIIAIIQKYSATRKKTVSMTVSASYVGIPENDIWWDSFALQIERIASDAGVEIEINHTK